MRGHALSFVVDALLEIAAGKSSQMACSKFSHETLLETLNFCSRDNLERLAIASHKLNQLTLRHFPSNPYRVFDELDISYGNSDKFYSLRHHSASLDSKPWDSNRSRYSFIEIQPYLGPTVRVENVSILIEEENNGDRILILTHEMESLSHLWYGARLNLDARGVRPFGNELTPLISPILHSRTIFQFRELYMHDCEFNPRHYPLLYSLKVIGFIYARPFANGYNLLNFLHKPGDKPIVVLGFARQFSPLMDLISEAFSRATSPCSFKIVFTYIGTSDFNEIEFSKTNICQEILEYKRGLPDGYHIDRLQNGNNYTLQRFNI
ncbi:hypothetical protein Ddc_14606 [Ditylenchus destructor]|nr:hypothetical protein Ddc_14606 [Ditylenchus destructor]